METVNKDKNVFSTPFTASIRRSNGKFFRQSQTILRDLKHHSLPKRHHSFGSGAKAGRHDPVAKICHSCSDLARSDPWRATPNARTGEINKIGCKQVYDNLSSLSSERTYGRTKSGHRSDTSASSSTSHARQTLHVSV